MTRPLVAVGELQRRGMTVMLGPRGSFVTRGHVATPTSGSLELEHSTDKGRKRHERSGAD